MKRQVKSLPDTNIIIRYLVADVESSYAMAKAFFDQIRLGDNKAVILESVIAECIYVLTNIYKVPRSKAANSLIDILHYRGIVNPDQDELIRALDLFTRENKDIVDCILCVKASGPEMSLLSLDHDLNQIYHSEKE